MVINNKKIKLSSKTDEEKFNAEFFLKVLNKEIKVTVEENELMRLLKYMGNAFNNDTMVIREILAKIEVERSKTRLGFLQTR